MGKLNVAKSTDMSNELDNFDICIVGAGVVGLAIAYQLSIAPATSDKSIVVLERESSFGQHTSSRNSEVIHAGIYYATASLKARLCVKGKAMLYEHCERYNVPYKRIGKLIVAQEKDTTQLEAIRLKAAENGVIDLQWLNKQELRKLEPTVCADAALLSPSTGIIDSHSYMQSLLHLAELNGVQYAPHTRVDAVEPGGGKFIVHTEVKLATHAEQASEPYRFQCGTFINSSGLYAQALAQKVAGLSPDNIPPLHLCKGDYFSYSGKSPFRHLIYPVPEPNAQGLGIHATLDVSSQLRFGPDTEYVGSVDYAIDENKARDFARAISSYYPAVSVDRLSPAYAGIRPKLSAAGEPAADFIIHDELDSGIDGLIQLFGMESPALTSSLAIGEYVSEMVVRSLAGTEH